MCDYLHEKDILRKLQCIQTNKIWVKISLVIKKIHVSWHNEYSIE